MKRPAFQFYPADWRSNAKLRRCSEAARGAWVDVLCLLHDCDDYGMARWPIAEIARAAGVPLKLLKELVQKGVLKGGDTGCEAYMFTPRHAGRDGEPVTLIPTQDAACWYCSRFVRDEYIRKKRGSNTQFSEDNQPPKRQPKPSPKPPFGDGPSSSSSSSSSLPSGDIPPNPLCTIEQALGYAPNVRMTPEQSEHWWHTRNKAGWTMSSASGHPRKITSWQSDMATSLPWVAESLAKSKQGGAARSLSSKDVGI